ncbi:hypothetical protein EDC05_003252 [Coemansia umbellata]|nr:hypothetical protein EDC05_003252 [Coemansia umbellata]
METTTEYYIPTADAQLHARLVLPAAPIGVFIVSHGLLDSKDSKLFAALQAMLAGESIGSLAFDFRGNGRSTGSTGYGNYLDEAEDLRRVVEHAAERHKVIGLIGHSKGASSMLLFAAKYPYRCPPLVVSISARFFVGREPPRRWKPEQLEQLARDGRFMWRVHGSREYWITEEQLRLRRSTDMAAVRGLPLHRCFVLNVMGAQDRVVPEDDVLEYDRQRPRANTLGCRRRPLLDTAL